MIIIDDDIEEPSFHRISNSAAEKQSEMVLYSIGKPVKYNFAAKTMGIYNNGCSLGIILQSNHNTYISEILYKGFLLKNPIDIPNTLPGTYALEYVKSIFARTKNHLISLMPRVKALKRLNFRILSVQQVQLIYDNIDIIIRGYEELFNPDYAAIFKALLVTTPFYVLDDGKLFIYRLDKNELSSDLLSEGANFLCYFTYNMTKCHIK